MVPLWFFSLWYRAPRYHASEDSHVLPAVSGAVLIEATLQPMSRCDSIAVLFRWELTSVSRRYSQGEGINTFLSRTTYFTNVWYIVVCGSFPACVWLSSVARSCANKDANNKDCVCKPYLLAGLNHPPPSETISPITWFGTISTRLAKGSSWTVKPGTL